MAAQSTNRTAPVTVDASGSGDEEPPGSVPPKNSKWTLKPEKCLLFNMIRLKPCGINKHLNVLLLREKMCEDLNINIPTSSIWKYLETMWDIEAADVIENANINTHEEDFSLPEEYEHLISEEKEKLRKAKEKEKIRKAEEKERFIDEINKRRAFVGLGKTRSKSNSMSSVDSKDGLVEIGTEEIHTYTRRSLRTYDKLEDKDSEDSSWNNKKLLRVNNKSDELNRSKDSNQLNKKNQLRNIEMNEKIPKARGRKRKLRNESESSFSSDSSKQPQNYKNNLTDLTVSDDSSRSLTPEILRAKTSYRSVTPELNSRKSNLRSNDKDLKSKHALEKACIKSVEIILPDMKIERFKHEKQTTLMESKTKNVIQNRIDSNNKAKNKIRNRVTSDLLVVQQSPDVQPLGRRSCSNKNS